MSQMFILSDIESKLKRIEEDPEGTGTAHLFNTIQDVSSLASRAFEPLFERQVSSNNYCSCFLHTNTLLREAL